MMLRVTAGVQSENFIPFGIILTGAAFQAQGRISRVVQYRFRQVPRDPRYEACRLRSRLHSRRYRPYIAAHPMSGTAKPALRVPK